LELQAPDIVKWICDEENKNITRQDTITFLDDYLKFEQLKQNHTEVFQDLVKKILSISRVLKGFSQVSETMKDVETTIFKNLAKINNQNFMGQEDSEVKFTRTQQCSGTEVSSVTKQVPLRDTSIPQTRVHQELNWPI
jgi:hypothetical protein